MELRHRIKINVMFVSAAYFHPNDCNGNDDVAEPAYIDEMHFS